MRKDFFFFFFAVVLNTLLGPIVLAIVDMIEENKGWTGHFLR